MLGTVFLWNGRDNNIFIVPFLLILSEKKCVQNNNNFPKCCKNKIIKSYSLLCKLFSYLAHFFSIRIFIFQKNRPYFVNFQLFSHLILKECQIPNQNQQRKVKYRILQHSFSIRLFDELFKSMIYWYFMYHVFFFTL